MPFYNWNTNGGAAPAAIFDGDGKSVPRVLELDTDTGHAKVLEEIHPRGFMVVQKTLKLPVTVKFLTKNDPIAE